MAVAIKTKSRRKRAKPKRGTMVNVTTFDRWIDKVVVKDRDAREQEWFSATMRDGYQCTCPLLNGITDDPDSWSVAPYEVMERGTSFIGKYRCPSCGLRWECGFSMNYVLNGPWEVG